MTDETDTHERYRGGGREVRDRWNREDRNGPGGTNPSRSGPEGRSRPPRGHGDTERGGGSGPPTDGPGHGRNPTGSRPASGLGGQEHLEIVAGGGRSPGERRQAREGHQPGQRGRGDQRRRSDEQFGPDRKLPATGEEYRQPYGQPVGRQGSDAEPRRARSRQRRVTREGQRRSRSGERSADSDGDASSDAGSSDGDGADQPRDPETGQFLPKGRAGDE